MERLQFDEPIPEESTELRDDENIERVRELGYDDNDILNLYRDDEETLKRFFSDDIEEGETETEQPRGGSGEEKTEPDQEEEKEEKDAGDLENLSEEQIRELAKLGASWQNAFVRDPVNTTLMLLQSDIFTPEQKRVLMERLEGIENQESENVLLENFDPEEYEPETDLERVLVKNYNWLVQGPQYVSSALLQRDTEIRYTFAELAALKEQVRALSSLLNATMPEFQAEQVFKYINQHPETTIEEAVKEIYGKKLAKEEKILRQKNKARPESLKQMSNNMNGDEKKPKTIYEMYRIAGLLLDQEK